MFTRAIVRPPGANFSKGLTTAGLGPPDLDRALLQHEAYCRTLVDCGLALTRLEVDGAHPDSTFVEDAAVLVEGVSANRSGGPIAILTRPGAASRRGEVDSVRAALAGVLPVSALRAIESPATLDGGDVCQAERHFFIGISDRTNEAGAKQLSEFLKDAGYSSSFVDIRRTVPSVDQTSDLLHLKSGLTYLGDNRLVVTEALADRAEFSGYELVRVASGEEYAANCVRVNDFVLIAAGYPAFGSRLQALGYKTIALEMSEFQKMDGGLSCLSLRF
ncbi:MAG TPA: hypothetical protein VJT71_00795 [Pyrinomonadaceae bacterium]|nr:hypothetical protein [Pyrinomonadaceae bacterium]